jgi:transposase
MTTRIGTKGPRPCTQRPEVPKMETPDDVAAMLRLHAAGWGAKRIARELGCARNTVRRYIRQGGWQPYAAGERAKVLDEHAAWVQDAFETHGNGEVIRQELKRKLGVTVSARTVQRAISEPRRRRVIEALATVRFETPPGRQMQADFGEIGVVIGGERTKVHVCVLTLGWSRRMHVQAFRNEKQDNWLAAMEESFRAFGGVPQQMLVDNARALVKTHNVETGEVVFSEKFAQFARYWGFKPRACAPYRARTKGKDESGVKYVKRNAIAGRSFDSWEELESWLMEWTRDVADVRVHGTTGEQPIVRFDRLERSKLQPLPEKGPFLSEREFARKVHNDACVEIDRNWYTVPWTLVRTWVQVVVRDRTITISHGGKEVATHVRVDGRRQRVVNPEHWAGLSRSENGPQGNAEAPPADPPTSEFVPNLDPWSQAAGVAA